MLFALLAMLFPAFDLPFAGAWEAIPGRGDAGLVRTMEGGSPQPPPTR
jgi:hypothetical protein